MTYGHRIAELRKKSNLTQEEMAHLIKISRAALSHYEQNRREPDFSTLKRIANVFNVSLDYILGYTDDPHSHLDQPTQNFVEDLELSDQDVYKRFSLLIDGRELSKEEAKRFIAFIRAERSLSEE